MKNRICFVFCCMFLVCVSAFAQRGKDGARTVAIPNVIYNEYTTLTADAPAGTTIIQVAASGLNANNRFGYSLSPGDLIMIIQMQGAAIQGGIYWSGWGYIDNYNHCGNNEFAEVRSVPGLTSIEFSCPLTKDYTASGRVQVVRVPRLTKLTVNSNDTLTCDPWNGATGGIVAVEVTDTTLLQTDGIVSGSGKGFRGGVNSDMNSTTSVTFYASSSDWDGAEKGEGIAGYQADYDPLGGRYGKNAGANGGGGGNAHNGGGGGGANGSWFFTWNGKGNPDTSVAAYKIAWDLEAPDFHKNISDGGGRGGYTYSWDNMDATVTGPGNAAWGGDYRRNEGGQGGRPLDYNFGRLYLGGGGGAGDQGPNTDFGGDGGRGGGIICCLSYGVVTGNGRYISNGYAGQDAQGTAPWNGHAGIDGGGGGGAGGTIILNSTGTIANTLYIWANGGKGGDQIKTKALLAANNGEAEGPGGGGGGGHIAISNGSPVRTAFGGANGISTAQSSADNGVEEFPPNGATAGGRGMTDMSIQNFTLTVADDTVCVGDDAMLIANLNGSVPSGTTVIWYDSEVAGNMVGNGDTLWVTNAVATQSFYAATCPGVYRVEATVNIIPVNIDAGSDLYLCNMISDTLHATGGVSYSWTPAGLLNDPASADPVATVTATTQFFVSGVNADGCAATDSVTIFVNTVQAVVSPDTAICYGNSINLSASGGNDYLWSTGDTTASVSVTPLSMQTFSVTVSAGACSDSASVSIIVNPLPAVNIGNDTVLCQGDSLLMNAGNPGSSYLWQDNSTDQTYTAQATGNYSVTVTSLQGCTASAELQLTVNPWADATINPEMPVCANHPPFDLTAAEPGGTWSGTGITDPAAGTFNPAIVVPGSHLITYTITGLCGNSDQETIMVLPVPDIALVATAESCAGANDAFIDLSVSGGTPPYQIFWSNLATSEDLSGLAPGNYSVTVTDTGGCVVVSAVQLLASEVECYTPHIYVPNIFSPNGDMVNDVLMVRGAGILSVELVIYDRWGEKVFETKDAAGGWDGNFRNKAADPAVYFYYLNAELEGAQKISEKGSITLVR